MELTNKSAAWLGLYLTRGDAGAVEATVGTALPGAEVHHVSFKASSQVPDEIWSLKADFHNEWRAWGNLLDAILDDWATEAS